MNNILIKLKPSKIIGKGSEGIVILTHDDKYIVKIYISNKLKSLMFFNIVTFLQNNYLPTIYKSYLFTQKRNFLNRYLHNLPEHFSYINNVDLKSLSTKYKMDNKLFEIMKKYDISLKDFIEKLKRLMNKLKLFKKSFNDYMYKYIFSKFET